MTAIEQLESLNPVPEPQGNPGAFAPPRRRLSGKRAGLLAVAAAVLTVSVFVINRPAEAPIDVEVALPPRSTPEPSAAPPSLEQPTPTSPTTSPAQTSLALPIEIAPSSNLDSPASDQRAIGRLVIPDIDVDLIVVDGVSVNALRNGPGLYPGSAFPGQSGNTAIAGHRTIYGAPFHRLDELEPDDLITVTTLQGEFEYRVDSQSIVDADQVSVLAPTDDNRLTLTTAHPKYRNTQRLVVVASLVGAPAPTISFERLPLAAEIEWNDQGDIPDISDDSFRNGGQPYFSFFGNADPLDTARAFVASQFGSWSDGVDLAVATQTERTAAVRWTNTRHDTGGWIIVFFADGTHHVWDMTMDGVDAPIYQSQTGGRGFARSSQVLSLEVFRPVPFSASAEFEQYVDAPHSDTPLVISEIGETEADTLISFPVEPGDSFQEVRMVVRNADGEQVGGIARSLMLPMLDEFAVVTEAGDSHELRTLLESHPEVIAGPLSWDRWQSVGVLQQFAPELAPETVAEVPRYEATMLALRPVSSPYQFQAQSELLEVLTSTGTLITIPPLTGLASADEATELPAPADLYVINELPSVDLCQHLRAAGWALPEVQINDDRQIFATPEQARDSVVETATGHTVEFRSTAGETLGFANPTDWSPWAFHSLAVVELVGDGWVLDRWERAPC